MVGGDDSGHLIDGLPLARVLGCVHTDRRCGYHPAALPGGDGDGGEGSTFVLAGGLVSNGFVGPALAGEHRVLGFDVLGGKVADAIRMNWPRSCPPNTRWYSSR